ncbi:DEAD/DEAH box helicase [Ceratobasidium sp. AG-Ba]|nr:DEAD/DEAH box helicase [Ceratobasidium sp. AG-Ba]
MAGLQIPVNVHTPKQPRHGYFSTATTNKMRRVSRPLVAPTSGKNNPYDNRTTNSVEYRNSGSSQNAIQYDFYDDQAPVSSPTPLPRRSQNNMPPRMLGFGNHPDSPDFSDYEQEVLEDIGEEYGYTDYQQRCDYASKDEDSAYMDVVKHPDVHLRVRPEKALNTSANLVPVSILPDWCRGIFKFGVFNAMQSECFSTAVNTNSNMVISAPTGAGKTVLFELAIVKLLQGDDGTANHAYKCVYMAPTKAICSERHKDWSNKFSHAGVKCVELTGDTMATGRQAWKEAKDCTIIITTPEKWDSLTRNWNDSSNFLQRIKLFMVDEVHTVAETTRGSCLEVVVSRMMQRGNSVRFVLLSATAPNIEDIKNWLSSCSSGEATAMFKFGDDFRPCKLKRHVYGFPRPQGHNDFQFMKALDYKLLPIIQEHSAKKPVLVFCPTRKSVMTTASYLTEVCQKLVNTKQGLPWDIPGSLDIQFSDAQLHSFANFGLGVHHAGLSRDDRRAVEELFTQRRLNVIVATSTLAVGVNFPAHVVIVKGVMQWAGNGWAEYSAQDIMQMLGRAGRPQFDREGVAIIMCEKQLEAKYSLLSIGGSHLESTLHHNLTEHINSEIGLGTINSVDTAKQWLRKTFLFRRIQKNPTHYTVGIDMSDGASWEERMDALVTDSLRVLHETQLIHAGTDGDELILTEFGEIMSYYIRQSTVSLEFAGLDYWLIVEEMKAFISISSEQEACLRSLLLAISGAEEFKDTLLRAGERQIYQKLTEHESIRFPIKKPETPSDKVSLLLQAVLGGVPLMSNEFKTLNSQPHMEALNVMRHAPRMIAALVDTALTTKNGAVILSGTSLMRSINAKVWEDRPAVLKQFEGIGDKSFKILAENGIATIKSLSTEDPGRIEMLLNRRSPYGSELISAARSLPKYSISVAEKSITANRTAGGMDVNLSITISAKLSQGKPNRFSKNFDARSSSILTILSDNQYVDFRRISTKTLLDSAEFSVTASLTKPSQTIIVFAAPLRFAGIVEQFNFKPSLPAKSFPTLNTRPLKESEVSFLVHAIEPARLTVNTPLQYQVSPEETPKFDYAMPNIPDTDKDSKVKKQPARSNKESAAPNKLRLANGNYPCQHKCKDKATCRHICCREGLPKPSSSPKRAKVKDHQPTAPQTLSSPIQTRPTPEKHKAQVDQFYSRTNDGASGINCGLLIPQRAIPYDDEVGRQHVDIPLPCAPTVSGNDTVSSASDSELPEPSRIVFCERHTPAESPDSYDNSDMDTWAANIPSEVLDVEDGSIFFAAPEQPKPRGKSSRPTQAYRVGMKRTNSSVGTPQSNRPAGKRLKPPSTTSEEIIDLDTPPCTQHMTEFLPAPATVSYEPEAIKLLFRPTSSSPSLAEAMGSTGRGTPVVPSVSQVIAPTPDIQEGYIENLLDDVFDSISVVPPNGPLIAERSRNVGVPRLDSTLPKGTSALQKPMLSSHSQSRAFESNHPKQERRERANSDPMADLNAWLEENGL